MGESARARPSRQRSARPDLRMPLPPQVASFLFPLPIMALVPVRQYLLPRIFDRWGALEGVLPSRKGPAFTTAGWRLFQTAHVRRQRPHRRSAHAGAPGRAPACGLLAPFFLQPRARKAGPHPTNPAKPHHGLL